MPAEEYDPIPEGVTDVSAYMREQWSNPNFLAKRERMDKERTDAISHADMWLSSTKKPFDPDTIARGQKLIKQGRRGLLTANDVNEQMALMFGADYPQFDPGAIGMTIPDHLGDQFK